MLICTTAHKHQELFHSSPGAVQHFCWHYREMPLMKPICYETRVTCQPGAGRSCTERHQEHHIFKEWKQWKQMLCKTAEPWKASHFRCWICFPQGKLGKHHHKMDSKCMAKVSTWMAKGIINLIKAPLISETSGGKAGRTSSYKRRLPEQRLLPLVGRTQIKTLCGITRYKKHLWDRFFFSSQEISVHKKPKVEYKTCNLHLWNCPS